MDVFLCPQRTHLIPFRVSLCLPALYAVGAKIVEQTIRKTGTGRRKSSVAIGAMGFLGNFHFLFSFSAFSSPLTEGMYYFCNQGKFLKKRNCTDKCAANLKCFG